MQALKEAGREDLIGYDEKCIIRPSQKNQVKKEYKNGRKTNRKKH